jgi:L-alanine-DL-glutamate epimerase-like enolase superfamily enzyme
MGLQIREVEVFCYRAPVSNPVVTSFGSMSSRPAVFVRLSDHDGLSGWGEVWCNFPSGGAEHRAHLIGQVLAPMICGRSFEDAAALFHELTNKTMVLALQSGEPGPFAQIIAGIDIAAWDLLARRCEKPLWRMLEGLSPTIHVYASGINPRGAEETAERAQSRGHRAFKLKIGFDPANDRRHLSNLRHLLNGYMLAADANQAWSTDQAIQAACELEEYGLEWLEEPLRADAHWSEWQRVSARTSIPLAAGENIRGAEAFRKAISAGAISILQPDAAKWGGITMGVPIAREILAAGRRFCPHYLGGGIGLLASAHLLASVGGDGLLEIDINANPLREICSGEVACVNEGRVTLSDEPGLGSEPDLKALAKYRTI